METSDSENFESADEDFDSENEEHHEKPKHSLAKDLGHKIAEPDLCKLKVDKGNEITEELKVENFTLKDIENNPLNTAKEVNKVETSCANSKLQEITSFEGNNQETHRFKEREQDEQYDNKTSNVIIGSETREKKCEINEKKNSEREDFKPEIEETTNLWNDDEIDWGAEAEKEVTNTDDETQKLSNEDSGWDDFDADWETESTLKHKSKENIQTKDQLNKPSNAKPNGNSLKAKENMWDDDWEPLEKPVEKGTPENIQSGWGGWGNWGVSSILNTATQSVSTLTSHVSQGLSTVLESGMGIPDPEEMAKINKLSKENEATRKCSNDQSFRSVDNTSSNQVAFGLGINFVSGVSHLTKFVESTGTKVITGSLDTLETIGKKTMEVLQDGDPGLKKKRAYLTIDTGKPTLSQVLREAKEKAENKTSEQIHPGVKKTKNYEALFDDHQGLVHLEALEMLSKLCNMKLENFNNSLTGASLKDVQETLEQVKELCELPEDDEDEKITLEEAKEKINEAIKVINIPITYEKLFATCEETATWLASINLKLIDETGLHEQAIETLAQLTAFAVEQFHKTGELLLVKDHRSTADEADSLVQITATIKLVILNQSSIFTDKLSSLDQTDKEKINGLITNIFYEAANSGSYIQDAFQLLIPVLQVGAV